MTEILRRIRSVGDYQFGSGIGTVLFPDDARIVFSKRTGRIRYIYLDLERLATMRPKDGLFSLSIEGARRIVRNASSVRCFVVVQDEVSKFIINGGDVFSKHVIEADDEIRSKDEVIIVDKNRQVLAVGKALLSAEEMKSFKRGVAVKVRHGCTEEG
jgi:predicted RNA-binding protein (TIGR00451 family)